MPKGTMDFFAAQATARRRTAWLVLSFLAAWVATIALVAGAIAVMLAPSRWLRPHPAVVANELLLWSAIGVSVIVLLGVAWHASRLAEGGEAIARMLGGRPIDRGTADAQERRLVNVVEELAIAAGIPVPGLWVLEGAHGINAFAAGATPDRAVVGVTRAALDALGRDELQGVVAHELSHLVNGDTRLDLRLMALAGGLTALATVGRTVLRGTDGPVRQRVALPVVAAGILLVVFGSIGAFFGRLIRLAVSRQREYLADAAAVQFTRDPEGLAGALSKIAQEGSTVSGPFTPEAAHVLFANGLDGWLDGFLASHPPIAERIRRLAPALPARRASRATAAPSANPVATAASSSTPVDGARRLLARLPAPLAAATRDPYGAAAFACALLLDPDERVRAVQSGTLRVHPALLAEACRLTRSLAVVPREGRLAALDLALPALDALSTAQAEVLVADLAALAAADGRTTVFEWSVQRIVRRRLAPQLGARPPPARLRSVDQVEVELLEVLSTLARLGSRDEALATEALAAGLRVLGVTAPWRLLPRDRIGARRLEAALARLDEAVPSLKARIVAACAGCARADGRITTAEDAIVRAVAASLGSPAPALAAPLDTAGATAA